MWRVLISLLLVLALTVPVGTVMAADNVQVTVTATPTYVTISIDNSSFDFSVVEANTDEATGEAYFTITNESTVAVDTTIKCDGWDGSTGNDWTYGAAGADTGRLMASIGSGYTIAVPVDPTTADLHTGITAGNTASWGLELDAPSSFGFGDEQTTHVTVTAAQAA